MTAPAGRIKGCVPVVQNGGPLSWKLVIVSEGYTESQLSDFKRDVDHTCDKIFDTAPFNELRHVISIDRIEVCSTESGAKDPSKGRSPATYFDAKFEAADTGGAQRVVTVDQDFVKLVVKGLVPDYDAIAVCVNATDYGGSGGDFAAVYTCAPESVDIALHELGHTAFHLADEYPYPRNGPFDETGHQTYAGAEPAEINVTNQKDRLAIFWRNMISPGTAMPTTRNSGHPKCHQQPNPLPPGTVGAFEGGKYHHCGIFRPEYDCKMRELRSPFCKVCQWKIRSEILYTEP
jgi:hypothetical protein